MNKYTEYPNREAWLNARNKTLGASEVASALGMGFATPFDLWREKTGRAPHSDLSDNERVRYGSKAETHLRSLFELQFCGEYEVEYNAYRVYRHADFDFLTCTLDGELIRLSDGVKGVWECKTAKIQRKSDLDEWNGRIKQAYYVQICEQLVVTGYDFAVVTAQLILPDGNSEIRHYTIERSEIENDIEYVKNEAVKFWRYVQNDTKPPLKLTL